MKEKLSQLFNKIAHNMAIHDLNIMHNSINVGISYNSILYLDIIAASPGKYTASALAKLLCVAKPAITQKINELEKSGYIIKKPCMSDRRKSYLFVTEKLLNIRNDSHIFDLIIQKYSTSELQKFCEIMDFLAEQYSWSKSKNKYK